MTIRKATIPFLTVVTTILFLSCTSRQSKAPVGEVGGIFDEANLPAAEKLIREAMDLYDSSIILAITDSLEDTGDISATTASYYRGAAASNKGCKGTTYMNIIATFMEIFLKKTGLSQSTITLGSSLQCFLGGVLLEKRTAGNDGLR